MKKLAIALSLGVVSLSAAAPIQASAADKEKVAIDAPEAGMGQIVFFRPGGMGGVMGCGINENGARVSALGSSKYFVIPATPGEHVYYAKSEAKDELTIEVEPGETYYIKCKIKMGLIVGRPNISPSTAAEFDKVSSKLNYVDADDFGPKETTDGKDDEPSS